MKLDETLLEMVGRHVREGQGHILRQREVVQHLDASASPLAAQARALLAQFEASQDDHKSHLAQITKEMQSGRRDADGTLLPLRP